MTAAPTAPPTLPKRAASKPRSTPSRVAFGTGEGRQRLRGPSGVGRPDQDNCDRYPTETSFVYSLHSGLLAAAQNQPYRPERVAKPTCPAPAAVPARAPAAIAA